MGGKLNVRNKKTYHMLSAVMVMVLITITMIPIAFAEKASVKLTVETVTGAPNNTVQVGYYSSRGSKYWRR